MRVLSVDDNHDIVKLLQMTVESLGHEFHAEHNGLDGLRRIRSEKFDLVFLDIQMPGYTGLDVVDALVQDGILTRQPVVLFTASYLERGNVKANALKKGVHSVLAKPADIDTIMQVIMDVQSSAGS